MDLSVFFIKLIGQYHVQVEASGAIGQNKQFAPPALFNDILPMFQERWISGPVQPSSEVFELLKPAFQLASRLLSEDHCLSWFSHLTFGERRRHPDGEHDYISPNAYSKTPEALAIVRANLRELGQVVSIMFAETAAWGETYVSRRMLERSHDLRWPRLRDEHLPGHYNRPRPVIVLSSKFSNFFRKRYAKASQAEAYRALFLTAATLVHEVAHAYNFWLNIDGGEPLWSKHEKNAELGWSWEQNILGFGMQTFPTQVDKHAFPALFATNALSYTSSSEREKIFTHLVGSHRTDHLFTKADSSGTMYLPPHLKADSFRASGLYLKNGDDPRTYYMAAIHTIPMKWIVNWFQEDHWRWLRSYWRQQGAYSRPTLGDSFLLVYHHRGDGRASVLRPLNPESQVDRNIIEQRRRGDHSL